MTKHNQSRRLHITKELGPLAFMLNHRYLG